MDIGYPGYPWLLVNGSAIVRVFFWWFRLTRSRLEPTPATDFQWPVLKQEIHQRCDKSGTMFMDIDIDIEFSGRYYKSFKACTYMYMYMYNTKSYIYILIDYFTDQPRIKTGLCLWFPIRLNVLWKKLRGYPIPFNSSASLSHFLMAILRLYLLFRHIHIRTILNHKVSKAEKDPKTMFITCFAVEYRFWTNKHHVTTCFLGDSSSFAWKDKISAPAIRWFHHARTLWHQ